MNSTATFQLDETKDQFDLMSGSENLDKRAPYVVRKTNWSEAAQEHIRTHIITAIDTSDLATATKSIYTAHIDKWGGTVAVHLMEGSYAWSCNTRYHFTATYKGIYISIWSSH